MLVTNRFSKYCSYSDRKHKARQNLEEKFLLVFEDETNLVLIFLTSYFELSIDSYDIVRNNTARSQFTVS